MKALGSKVILKQIKSSAFLRSGELELWIPNQCRQMTLMAKVVDAGESKNLIVGDYCMFDGHRGTSTVVAGEELLIMDEADILLRMRG